MFVRLKRPKRKYVMPNGRSRRSAMRPYGQSKPRPKAQIVKSHYKLNERRPGTLAMPPTNRGLNADSLWTA